MTNTEQLSQSNQVSSTGMFDKKLRTAIAVLLTILVVIQAIGLVVNIKNQNLLAARTASCQKVADAISIQLASMPSDYEKDVYNNPKVDNINKQQLLNNEYIFYTQQAIAQLLVACH
jgi:IMP cyclohydrolase